MTISIGITTTPKRQHIFKQCLAEWGKLLPENAIIHVYCDDTLKGIAIAKNKVLEMCSGSDYIFLVDDDVFPNYSGWHIPYIQSGLNHACWNVDRKFISLNQKYVEYETPNGCILFFTQLSIQTVGGWDTDFKGYGYEHVNVSDRIFNNGLTPARYIDVRDSKGLFTMINCESSISDNIRAKSIPDNRKLYQQKYLSKEFKSFK